MAVKSTPAVFATVLFALLLARAGMLSHAAEVKPAPWQADWDKTLKAAEEEGAVTIYMTSAFESVFREAFQKKFPKIKVSTVDGSYMARA